MNGTQRTYLKNRLLEIKEEKIRALDDALSNIKRLNNRARISLIENKAVSLKPDLYIDSYTRILECYDFTPFEKSYTEQVEAVRLKKKEINDEMNRVMDEMVLGDSKKAMELLADFKNS